MTDLSFAEKSKIVSQNWEGVKGEKTKKVRLWVSHFHAQFGHCTFQTKKRTGYDLFRQENTQTFRNQGLKGNAMSAKVGEAWRKLSPESKQKFTMKVYALGKLDQTNKLVKSRSVTMIRKGVPMKKSGSLKL